MKYYLVVSRVPTRPGTTMKFQIVDAGIVFSGCAVY